MVQPPAVPPTEGITEAQPVRLELVAPLEVARWRPLVNWLLAIPQIIVVYVLQIALNVTVFISFFTVLFTKKIPRGMFDFMVMVLRYQWRVGTFYMFMREPYPPFDFEPGTQDQEDDPARFSIDYPEELNRWLPFVKWLLAIPHYFVLIFLFIGGFFAWIGAFFAVLFTGKYPQGIRDYMVGVARWCYRVQAYVSLMRDDYPPFSLD